jgi:tRNA-dihydrouridine synthase
MPKPFFVLAPMDDVTDVVFRRVVHDLCAPADLYMTEFVNVDGLQSPGRQALLTKLRLEDNGAQVIAQVWGKTVENYYKTAQDLVEMGFAGIDINMGCPAGPIVQNGCGSAMCLPHNQSLACEVIDAVHRGSGGKVPISVKTRLGYSAVDFEWHSLLLQQKLNMLTIHGRTRKEMSKVPADWDKIEHIRKLRDQLSPTTLIVGNGDVRDHAHGLELATKHGLDGIMIGRGVFNDPFCMAPVSPWPNYTPQAKIGLYIKHVQIFAETWAQGERKFVMLKKFAKVYINGFDGASDLRMQTMECESPPELIELLTGALAKYPDQQPA